MKNNKKGFLKVIIFILFALVLLSLLGFDIKKYINIQKISASVSFVFDILIKIVNFLTSIVINAWHIVVSIWNFFITIIKK